MNFQILGPLRVLDDDDREVALGGSKRAAVLALLLLHPNEVVSADRLIEELWEGQPPPTAAKSLQVHISRLRQSLGADANNGGPIVTRGAGYALTVDADQVDAARFERIVAEGSAALAEGNLALASARLRAALALWRGEALADFTYASFAQEPVARLEGLRTVAMEGAIEAELGQGRHAELIPELKTLVKRHPLSERLRGQLMLALYRSGRQAEALGVYRAGRRLLVDQLGIEPGADLRELERAILAQDPQLAAPEPERARRRQRSAGAPGGLLVGYEHELTALEDALERALIGQGRVALVCGEPGIGKTRLADELARVAQTRGAEVVWARCWDGGGAPAFWPWMQVLRALIGDRDPAAVRAELGDKASDLAQLIPDLDSPARAGLDPQEARFRLFDATAAFLRRAAAARPLMLVFDDLHAADASTLALLGFIGAAAPDMPMLVLATYRDTDVAGNAVLVESLTELTRGSDCVQLVLTGLAADDTAHFVELSSGVAPMGALAAAIHDVSAGNPLFVSELVRLLRAEDRLHELERGDELVLPRGVDQVIARRLQHLSDGCRRTLATAAVIGTEIRMPVLERAAGTDGATLLDQVEEAKSVRVIDEAEDGLRFSHDLVRQTLAGGLGAAERARTHLAVAEAIEALAHGDTEPLLPKLAYHYAEALPIGDAARAIEYTARAGDAADELMAYEDASALYTRAIELATEYGTESLALSELYLKLAEQRVDALDGPGAVAALDKAVAVAGGALPPALQRRATLAHAKYDLFDACVTGRERIEEVIEMCHELGDVTGEARAWNALAAWAHGHARFADAGEAATHALGLARECGSRGLADEALRVIGTSLAHGSVPVAEATARLRALLDEARNPGTRARLVFYTAMLAARAGRFDEMHALVAAAHSESVGAERDFQCCVPQGQAQVELLAGNALRAEAIARESCDDLERRGLTSYLSSDVVNLAEALVAQGRLDEAEAQLARGAAVTVETDTDAQHGQARARARLELARGDLAAAEASAREALKIAGRMQWPDTSIATQLLLAQILLAAERGEEARPLAEEALAASQKLEHAVYAEKARGLLGTRALAATR